MICRIWHGWTTPANAGPYETLLRTEIFAGIRQRAIAGFRGIDLVRRDGPAECEFVTIMWFDDLDAVRAFAGPDHETAVVPPPARALLARFDARSAHYSVVEGGAPVAEIPRLDDQIARAIAGEPWHGSSLAAILDGVNAETAARRRVPDAHSIREIVLHLTGWVREVIRRLEGAAPGVPPEGDGPAPGPTDDAAAWSRARADLDAAHRELRAALDRFPAARLHEQIVAPGATTQDAVTYYQTLLGLLQHDAYHAGQIAILRK
jgi:uncharacterized damage-inducible protein DinB